MSRRDAEERKKKESRKREGSGMRREKSNNRNRVGQRPWPAQRSTIKIDVVSMSRIFRAAPFHSFSTAAARVLMRMKCHASEVLGYATTAVSWFIILIIHIGLMRGQIVVIGMSREARRESVVSVKSCRGVLTIDFRRGDTLDVFEI